MISKTKKQFSTTQSLADRLDSTFLTIERSQIAMLRDRANVHCRCEHCTNYQPVTSHCDYYDIDWDSPSSDPIERSMK